MDPAVRDGQPKRISACLTALVILAVVISRSSTSVLTPLWLDALNNNTNTTHCHALTSYGQIDGFAIMCIVNIWHLVLFGTILLAMRIFCPFMITDNERKYDKREFGVIGFANALSGICFVYASSGCRTAPYLQSIAANFAIPVTFMIRYLVLRKRPTCRKTVCAMLVVFAEFTALLPDIVPDLESQKARKDDGGADGLPGMLWPLCFFLGFIPLALVGVVTEKAVKYSAQDRRHLSAPTEINIIYVLFWSYFLAHLSNAQGERYRAIMALLFNLLSHICLFWSDIIPGFGMSDGIVDFVKGFWFNTKCFFGYEGCHGFVTIVSVLCTVFLVINTLINSYFLRYLEGANYLAIINSIQTPLVFLFFTLFDENPFHWDPHAYVSTWLSLAALCIMLPAIYIYTTGDSEVVPSPSTNESYTEPRFHDNSQQTDTDDVPPIEPFQHQSERTPLIVRSTTPVSGINYNRVSPTSSVVCFHQRRPDNTMQSSSAQTSSVPQSPFADGYQQKNDGAYGSVFT